MTRSGMTEKRTLGWGFPGKRTLGWGSNDLALRLLEEQDGAAAGRAV